MEIGFLKIMSKIGNSLVLLSATNGRADPNNIQKSTHSDAPLVHVKYHYDNQINSDFRLRTSVSVFLM